MTALREQPTGLDAVRRVLRADAEEAARSLLEQASREAGETVSRARAEAAELLAAARAEGEAQGRAAARAHRASARRRARERVLAARRAAVDESIRRAVEQACALRRRPDYGRVVDGLAALARDQLGTQAVVLPDDEVGGVTARLGDRSVDYRLPEVARRCADAMAPDLEELWQ